MRPSRYIASPNPQMHRVCRKRGKSTVDKCVHCRVNAGHQSRKLCNPCYLDRSIREKYPAKPGAYVVSGDPGHVELPLDTEPCGYLPGSIGRMETYRWRVKNNLNIFHPLDHKPTGD